jgi:hypothetical protein
MKRLNEPKERSLDYYNPTHANDALVDRFERPVGSRNAIRMRSWRLWRIVYLIVTLALVIFMLRYIVRYSTLLENLTQQPMNP